MFLDYVVPALEKISMHISMGLCRADTTTVVSPGDMCEMTERIECMSFSRGSSLNLCNNPRYS